MISATCLINQSHDNTGGIDYMRKVMDGSSVADFGLLNRELSADLFLSGVVSTAQPEKIK
jgi:hypothetical protein